MRILVTGAGGFVGRHLCSLLRSSAHQVTALTSPRANGEGTVDLREAAKVRAIFGEVKPEAVVHLAARSIPHDLEGLDGLIRDNVAVAANVLGSVRATVPRARVLIVSSSSVYGSVPRERMPISESEPVRPVLAYGASKAAVEAVASVYHAQGLDIVLARPFNLAGPGQSSATVPGSFARRIAIAKASGDKTITVGNLHSTRDYTDVRDAAHALERLLAVASDFGPYNICTSTPRVVGDILADLQTIAGTSLTPVGQDVTPERTAADVPYQAGSRQRILDAVGWEPKVPWGETLRSVMEDWERRVNDGMLS